MNSHILYVATDGGTRGNGKKNCKASYAYIIIDNMSIDPIIKGTDDELQAYEVSGIVDDGEVATNNRGELTAIMKALQCVVDEGLLGDIVIISDSEYSLKSIDIWSRNWILNPKKMEGKANMDLINTSRDIIDEMRKTRKVTLTHVRSHVPKPDNGGESYLHWFLNDRVDKLSQTEL